MFEDCDGSGGANVANSDGATVPKIPSPVMNGSGDAPAVDVKPKCSAEVSSFARLLYRVVPQIENVAVNRHRSGLMSPYICQILKYVTGNLGDAIAIFFNVFVFYRKRSSCQF